MKIIKSILTLIILTLFIGINPAKAQWDEGVAAVKCDVHPWMNSVIEKHLESIMFETLKTFKTSFKGQGISDGTLNTYFKSAKSANYINKQTVQNFKAGSTLGFNIGMPPSVESVLIIILLKQRIQKSARLPYDMLGISAELGAALRKQGVNTGSSMAFLINTKSRSLGNTDTLRKLLK